MSTRTNVAILGGGLAGLQLARLLSERGVDCLVLEARDKVGGLCRTLRSGAHSWDLGPHAFYSRDPEAMAYYRALPVDYLEHDRDVKVCHHGPGGRIHEVGYPFENGLADLPVRHRLECFLGYLRASWCGERPFRDLRHWIDHGLGSGIAGLFMVPYNEKIWDSPLDRISMDLVSRKIEPEPPLKLLRNCLVSGTVGRAYQARFIYPRSGAGALPEAVASKIRERVRTGRRVERLEPDGKGWRVAPAEGEAVRADAVVSTIPVPELLQALRDEDLLRHRGSFHGNDTYFVAVGLKEGRSFGRFADRQWVFFAGPETFYRITLASNFTGDGHATLVAEITRKGRAADMGAHALVKAVLRDLVSLGIVRSEDDVALAEAHLERHTYPIPTLDLPDARRAVEESLARRRLFLLGRSGRWDYLNTDGVFLAVEDFVRRRLAELAEKHA